MISLQPVTLEGHGVRLEPMDAAHAGGLRDAASDGNLWELWFTAVPEPDGVDAYITAALEGQQAGHMWPWVVVEVASGKVIGSTGITTSSPRSVAWRSAIRGTRNAGSALM